DLTGLLIDGAEVAVGTAGEDQATAGGEHGGVQADRSLEAPQRLTGLYGDGVHPANVLLTLRELVGEVGGVHILRSGIVGEGDRGSAEVAERHVEGVCVGAVSTGGPVAA